MVLRLADITAIAELGLAVVAGASQLQREVQAPHVSELVRPADWLQGGELLMTIGLQLPSDQGAVRDYVRDVVAGGASGLALGLGSTLPHQRAPQPLIDAAEDCGLPLLTVPDGVPFIAVTKAVFAAQAAEQQRGIQRAFDAQRRLTAAAAAATGEGITALLRSWEEITETVATVTDPTGRLIASSGADSLVTPTDMLERVATYGLRGTATTGSGRDRREVLPVGTRRLRGLLLLAGEVDAQSRLLVSGLVSLLSLELERRHLADEPERRRRAAFLGRLLATETTPARAREILAAAGLATETVRMLAVAPPAAPLETAADLAMAVPGGLVRANAGIVELLVPEGTDARTVLERFACGHPAGIGPAVGMEAMASSLRQAHGLLQVSRSTGEPAESRASDSAQLLLGAAGPQALRGYADAVLAELDRADPAGGLVVTLATWLDTGGAWEATSDRLGIHRHTTRNRIDRIARLTGRRLADGDDRFDLWLATRIRQSAEPDHG